MEALDLSTQDDARQPDLAASLVAVYEKMRVAGVTEPLPHGHGSESGLGRTLAQHLLDGPIAGDDGPRLREWLTRFLALPAEPITMAHFECAAAFDFKLPKLKNNQLVKQFRDDLLPAIKSQWVGAWYADVLDLLRTAIVRIGEAFRARKRRESALDFADLEGYTLQLLSTNAAVRQETVARFDHVLIDELQDTNPLQWKIIDQIRTHLFAVGDVNQSIYGFRDADPAFFLNFRDCSAVEELHENYRSRPEILDTVSRMLHGQSGIEPRELIAVTAFPPATSVVERLVGSGDNAEEAEAALVAQRIRHWHDAGVFRYKQMAVLFRTFASADPLQHAFDDAGIPFLLSGGRNFMEERECLDLLNLLAALANPLDDVPLFGVLRSPLGGLHDDELFAMGREGRREWFDTRFGDVRRHAGYLAPDLLIARALDRCGYTRGLAVHESANVDKLLAWLRSEFRMRPRPLPELLTDLEALREAQNSPPAPPTDAGDVVQMMTIHAAKGLEFPAVFLCGLHRGTDPRSAPVLFSSALGIGAKWRNPVTQESVSDPTHAALKDREREREEAEANRLLYVGMTRAEDRLVLSYAEKAKASGWRKLAEAAVAEVGIEPALAIKPGTNPAMTGAAEGAVITTSVATGQYDSAASVTSVALFAACPRRYYLARYLSLEPEPDGPGTGAIELGLSVHRALAGQPSEIPEVEALAARFRASPLGMRAARATRVEREFDVLFELDDTILRGQIDLWFEEGGELILVDYKTDRDESAAYDLQLRLYALALERYTGRLPDRAVLHYLRSDRTVDVTLTPEDLAAARDTVAQFRQAQDDLIFPLKAGEQCRKCSFRGGLCPEGREGVRSGRVSWLPSSSPGPAISGP